VPFIALFLGYEAMRGIALRKGSVAPETASGTRLSLTERAIGTSPAL
jgi:hypothetical protein